MAHIGRPGPYLFRRDRNLNVINNTQGWYRRYIITFRNLPAGVANVLNGTAFDAGPDAYPSITEAEYRSPFTGFIPAIARVRLFFQINTGKDYFKGVELEIKNVGIILAGHWFSPVHSRAPGVNSAERWFLDFYDTSYFDAPPINQSVDVFPKLWSDGPPH